MDVEIECAAESLNQGDRAGLGRPTGEPGLLDQVRGDAAVHNAQPVLRGVKGHVEKVLEAVRDL